MLTRNTAWPGSTDVAPTPLGLAVAEDMLLLMGPAPDATEEDAAAVALLLRRLELLSTLAASPRACSRLPPLVLKPADFFPPHIFFIMTEVGAKTEGNKRKPVNRLE
jgi:hypothetical protein